MTGPASRIILHVDMDVFYAAVEQLDHPELRGRPILVGGDPAGRGVVSTASYEARPFGCHSAMPTAKALRLCPQAILIHPRMKRYVEVSEQVFEILHRFTPLVEPLSIDEAFLDVTGSTRLLGSPARIAQDLKHEIKDQLGVTASVGVAPNKFLAKLASDLRKPNGLVIVEPDGVQAFLDPLSISRLWGVGKATLPKLETRGIHTFGDLRTLSREAMEQWLGEIGLRFYFLVRGIDDRPVVTDREAKSISHEMTLAIDLDDREYLADLLLQQTQNVCQRLRRHKRFARTINLKVRVASFQTYSRSVTLEQPTDRTDTIWSAAKELFETWCLQHGEAVRLIGMGVSNLSAGGESQLDLFERRLSERARRLDQTVDRIRDRFGRKAVRRGTGGPDSEGTVGP